MIRHYLGRYPDIADSAWIDESAVVIGDVTLAEDVSIWPMAVVRGDVQFIRIGKRSNIQDGSVVHVAHDGPYSPGASPPTLVRTSPWATRPSCMPAPWATAA